MAMLTRLVSFVPAYRLRYNSWVLVVLSVVGQMAEAGNSNGSQDNNSRDNNQNYNAENSQSSSSKAGFFTRMDADVADMWLTPPSAWSNEYWQVFVGVILMGLLSIAMVLFLCFAPICCCREAHHVPEKVKIKSQSILGNDRQKKCYVPTPVTNTSLNAATRNDQHNTINNIPEGGPECTGPSDLAMAKQHANEMVDQKNVNSYSTNNYASGPITIGIGESAKNVSQTDDVRTTSSKNMGSKVNGDESNLAQRDHPIKKKTKYRRTSLWSEVVSVWSEFLQHGFNVPLEAPADQSHQNCYKPLQEEDMRSRRTRRANASASCSLGTSPTPRRIKLKHKSSTSSSIRRAQTPLEEAAIIEHDDNNKLDQENQGTMV